MFSPLATLFGNAFQLVRKAINEMSWAVAAVAAVFSVLAALILIGGYFLFLEAFGALLGDPYAGTIIARYVLEASFAVIFFLGAMSFVLSSFTFIFRAQENRMLMAFPVEPLAVFIYRFAGATLLSAWPVFFIGVPALTALGVSLQAPAEYYLFCLLLLALFVILIAAVGALVSFVIAWFARKISPGWLWLGEIAVFAFILASLLRRIMPRSLFGIFTVDSLAGARLAAERISDMFSLLPSHPFVSVLSAVLPFGQEIESVGSATLKITAITVAATLVLLETARRFFLPVWQRHEEGGFLARPEDAPAARPRRLFPRLFRWKYGYLFEKEWLTLMRNPEDVSRAGFLLLLLLLYVLAVRGLAAMEAFRDIGPQSLVVAFAFAAIGYFALTLGMRFIFPSLSMEGRSAWVVWSSPLHIHELFSWKLFFWSALTALPLLLVSGLTVALFGMPFWLGLFFFFAALCASVTLVAVTLGQGCCFPDFRDRDPQMLSTSPAGLAATAIGLIYLWVVFRYVRAFALVFLASGTVDVKSAFGILIVSWAIIAIYWIAAPRRMDRMELP